MTIAQLCIRNVDLASPQESVWEAAERMRQRAVGSLVVVDTNMHPIGIVTDRDLVERVLAAGCDPGTTSVGQVMTPEPRRVTEVAAIEACLSLMRSGPFRRLPVVDDGGRLVGLVSLDDILVWLTENFMQVGQLLRRETPRTIAARTSAQAL